MAERKFDQERPHKSVPRSYSIALTESGLIKGTACPYQSEPGPMFVAHNWPNRTFKVEPFGIVDPSS